MIITKIEEAAKQLNVSEAALRRWCVLLGWNGYTVSQNENSVHVLNERDFVVLKDIRDRLFHEGNLVEAVKSAIANSSGIGKESSKQSDKDELIRMINTVIEEKIGRRIENNEEKIVQLQAIVNHYDMELTELRLKTKHLSKSIAEQQNAIGYDRAFVEEQIKKRDEELMAILREMMETKRLVAATKEKKWIRKVWKFVFSY